MTKVRTFSLIESNENGIPWSGAPGALLANIGLGWEGLLVTNTLAYYAHL
jgi:hypothetical protein